MEDGNGSHSSSSIFENLPYISGMPPPSYGAGGPQKRCKLHVSLAGMRPPSYGAGGPQKWCTEPESLSDDCVICDDRAVACSSSYPSYRAGGPQKRCKLHGNFVIIRPKSSAQTIFHTESSAKIHEEEAICRFCYDKFEGENALMLICNCNKNTLAHESCSGTNQNNNNCDACGQELQKLHVTLHLEPFSNHSNRDEIKKRSSLVSRLRRIWLCSS